MRSAAARAQEKMKRSFKKGKSLLNKLSNSSLGSTGSSNSLQQAGGGGTATKEFTSGPSVRPPFRRRALPPSRVRIAAQLRGRKRVDNIPSAACRRSGPTNPTGRPTDRPTSFEGEMCRKIRANPFVVRRRPARRWRLRLTAALCQTIRPRIITRRGRERARGSRMLSPN